MHNAKIYILIYIKDVKGIDDMKTMKHKGVIKDTNAKGKKNRKKEITHDGLLRRFVAYYRPHKKTFFIDMLCSFIFAVSGLFYPIITRQIMYTSLPENNIKEVLIFSAVLLAIYIIRAGMDYYVNYYGHAMGVKMQASMRTDLFDHLEKLPYSFFDCNETGQLMTRMTNDLFDVSELAHHGPENLFITTFITIGSFVYLCTINWKLALIIFALLPFLILIAYVCRRKMKVAFRESREEIAKINATLENSIAGIRVTKAYANANQEQAKFEVNNNGYVKARSKAYRSMATFKSSMTFVTSIYNVVVLLAGTLFCIYDAEHFVVADLVAFMISINLFISPIQTLIQFFEQLQDGITGFRRFTAIMDVPVEREKDNARDIERFDGHVRFDDVTFSYDGEHDVLKHINLDIPTGKMYAFVGASGGGKTTLCHLIPKFYPLDHGEISIDGESIDDISNKSLRQNIGIVQQDVFLFTGTFKQNIEYGKIGASDEEIQLAAKRANIHDYIMSLPDGYDTQIGERGVKLSGGQKQRLSIARVFLKNPSILILDEATSALDNTTEALIQKSLFELCKGRTTLVVAHRLSTVRNADHIVVINKGEIQEEGTHEQLLANNGIYKSLYDSQFSDDIEIDDLIG